MHNHKTVTTQAVSDDEICSPARHGCPAAWNKAVHEKRGSLIDADHVVRARSAEFYKNVNNSK